MSWRKSLRLGTATRENRLSTAVRWRAPARIRVTTVCERSGPSVRSLAFRTADGFDPVLRPRGCAENVPMSHCVEVARSSQLPGRLLLGGEAVTVEDVVRVARDDAEVVLAKEALQALDQGAGVIARLATDVEPHYGVSTGFGALAKVSIPVEKRAKLQVSLVRSHAAGSGPAVEVEVVRAMMLLRLKTMASGRTGVRRDVAQVYAGMLNAGLTPVVREYGSLGCSGDLAPLAHCALAATGEGVVLTPDGAVRSAGEALIAAGIVPVTLSEKEGLALINGTDGMLGHLCLAVSDLESLVRTADVSAAMSVETLLATDAVFAADLQAMRPQPGQADSASNLVRMLAGSDIMASHRSPERCVRVQDAYSLRCAPQVHGAVRDTLAHARIVGERELASVIDNPVITDDGRVVSNGNFHGAPIAYVLDFLAIAVADATSIAERRIDRMLDPARSEGLPPFLADDPGTDSGMMIAQYTAAGIVSELKRLAVPASVDSIPSSAMQEDHVSMGWAAARKLRRAIDGYGRVLGIEVLVASRAQDLRSPLCGSPATRAVRDCVREFAPGPGPDEWLSPQIEAAARAVQSGGILRSAERVVGHLA